MVLPPKPPPISAGMTRMLRDVHAAAARAQSARTMNWPWVELQIVALPSADADQAGMRLDIALVHGLGLEAALDDHVGLLEAGLDVAELELDRARRCWTACRLRLDASVNMSSCRIGAPGFIASSTSIDMRQHLVVDLDQLQRLLGDPLALVAATAATAWPSYSALSRAITLRHSQRCPGCLSIAGPCSNGKSTMSLDGDDGLDARQRLAPSSVDRLMRAWACGLRSTLPPDHAGHGRVGADTRRGRDLVHAVGPDRSACRPLVLGVVVAVAL